MDRLAAQLGVDRATAEARRRGRRSPRSLGGMEANAQDPAGAASLGKAIGSHDAGLVEGGVDLDQVDTADGDKIVSNVFGGERDQVVNQLGSQGGGDSGADRQAAAAARADRHVLPGQADEQPQHAGRRHAAVAAAG